MFLLATINENEMRKTWRRTQRFALLIQKGGEKLQLVIKSALNKMQYTVVAVIGHLKFCI